MKGSTGASSQGAKGSLGRSDKKTEMGWWFDRCTLKRAKSLHKKGLSYGEGIQFS